MLLGGRYKLLNAPLSTGSYGSVYVAEDLRMPRRVAVKVLHPQHAANPAVRTRFRRELEAACRISHENVVGVHDIGEDPQLGLYYVMELVRGTPLQDLMTGAAMPWGFVYRVGLQIARALHAIHTAEIVHRDLKPQNIMLVERSSLEELVKVLDFGIASLKNIEDDERDIELTGARMVLGTPPYMSPEQTYMKSDRERLGLDIDTRSDIYSPGVILYEMASGRRPFTGDAHEIVIAHRLTEPTPLELLPQVDVPPEFAELVMRCLEKDPRDRPQSAKELINAIKACEFLATRPSPAGAYGVEVRELRRGRSGLVSPLVMLAMGAALAVLVFFFVGPTGSPVGETSKAAMALPAQKAVLTPPTSAPAEPRDVSVAAPPPTAPAADVVAEEAPKKVGVLVTSQPPGAEIIIDGESKGLTPSTLFFENLEKRDIKVTLRKDLHVEKSVVLPIGPELAGQTVVLSESLEKRRVSRPIKVSDPFKDL